MSRGKKLLILLAALAVTAACVILVVHFVGGGSENDSTELSVVDTADILSVSWVYDGDTFKLLPDDEGFWYIDGQRELDLDSTTVTGMVSLVSNLYAQKKVADDISDDKTYGFDKSELTVTVKTADSDKTFTLGDYNETAGYYYLKSSDSSSLWYVDSQLNNLFCVDSLDLVKRESLPSIEYTDVGYITIKDDSGEYNIRAEKKEDDVIFALENNDTYLDQSVIKNLISSFDNISWSGVEAIDIKASDLGKYGLDKPILSFAMTYTYQTEDTEAETGSDGEYPTKSITETSELILGTQAPREHEDDERIIYAMLSGGKNVYTLSQSIADQFVINYPDGLFEKSIVKVDTGDLTSLTVKYKGETYTVTTEIETAESDDSTAEENKVFMLDGNQIDLDSFIDLLSSFESTEIKDKELKNYGDEIISIILTDGKDNTQSIAIYELPSDSSSCAVSVDGSLKRLADYIDCDNIADSFRDALVSINE